jgi:hypothetical protein
VEEDRIQEGLVVLGEDVRVEILGETLQVRTENVLAQMPAIMEKLTEMDLPSGEVHLRENTLEDVFIQLTGRRLRS